MIYYYSSRIIWGVPQGRAQSEAKSAKAKQAGMLFVGGQFVVPWVSWPLSIRCQDVVVLV
jgi:hypothetical protein